MKRLKFSMFASIISLFMIGCTDDGLLETRGDSPGGASAVIPSTPGGE